MEVILHSSPTETTKRYSEKTSIPLYIVIMAFLRIPGYLLVFLKSTSRYVWVRTFRVFKDGEFFFPHGNINGISTMSLITLLLFTKTYTLCLKNYVP